MAALAPPKPNPWSVDRSGLTRAGRKFWPMDFCAPFWGVGGYRFSEYAQGLTGTTMQSGSKNGYVLTHSGRTGALSVGTQRNRTGSADDYVGIVFDGYRPGTSEWPVTFFWRGMLNQTIAGFWEALVGFHDTAVNNRGAGLAFRDARARQFNRNGSTTSLYAQTTVDIPTPTVLNVAGVTRGATDRSVWRDGRERGDDTSSVPTFPSQVNSVGIGMWSDSSPGQNIEAFHECAYIWPYELPEAMLLELEEDPYLPFRKGAFVFGYRTPAAAAGGTILPQMMQVA